MARIITSAKYIKSPKNPDGSGGENDRLICVIDGVTMGVPMDKDNIDYQLILEWIAAGNTPEAADQTVYKLTNRT